MNNSLFGPVNPLPTSRRWNPADPGDMGMQANIQSIGTAEGKPEATAAEQDGLMAQRMSAALAEAEILATRKAEAESGSTADAQSWLRSRSERRALLDLAIMIFEMQKTLKEITEERTDE